MKIQFLKPSTPESRELEQRYRESRLPRDSNIMTYVVLLTAIMLALFLFLDIMFPTDNSLRQIKVLFRISIIIFSLITFYLLQRKKISVIVFDRITFIWLLVIITHVYLDSAMNSAATATIITWDILIIFGIYTVVSFSQVLQIAAALYLTCASGFIMLCLSDTGWSIWETIATVSAYIFTNIFGLFLSTRFRQADRQQFLLLEKESKSRKTLADLNKTLSKTVNEKSKALLQTELLMREMNHRVKNNLAIIQSILNVQSRSVTDDQSRGALTESADRVLSISRIHEILSRTIDLKAVSIANYFKKLFKELAVNYHIQEPDDTIHLDIDDITLDMDTLIPVALIVNELATNSFKYAYTDGSKGEFFFSLKAADHGALVITVADKGIGLPKGFQLYNEKSLGMNIVSSLIEQLEAKIEYSSSPDEGTEFKIIVHDEDKGDCV